MKKVENDHTIQEELSSVKRLVYDKCGFQLTHFLLGKESKEYRACTFEINGLKVVSRSAKITPTKTGQFVTLWKRVSNGPIQPFALADPVDLFIVNIRKDNIFGQFVFPKSVLCQQGIISTGSREGKRAIRVYPPWDITTSKQAQKTQDWQLKYFLNLGEDEPVDLDLAHLLYSVPGNS